jgi:drug/metabolite transporter (DMT)-like permease
MPNLKNYLQLHFIVLIWGFTAILGLLISMPAVELVFFRTVLAALLLGCMLLRKKELLIILKTDFVRLLLTGGLIAAHWILFFGAARVSTASICLAGMATGSLWTSLLEPLILRRKISVLEIAIGLIVIAGLYVVFHFEFNHALGISMAIASAMLAALFTVVNVQFSARYNAYTITFYEMVGACIVTSLFLPFYKYFIAQNAQLALTPTLSDWFYIAILAFVCTVYAYSVAVKLMKKFSAFAINLTVNLEPVYGIVLAFLIFGDAEKMTPGFYLGTLIILTAVLIYPVLNKYLNKRKEMRLVKPSR